MALFCSFNTGIKHPSPTLLTRMLPFSILCAKQRDALLYLSLSLPNLALFLGP